jgi:hypothetical protein
MANDAATVTSTIPARALRMETETPFRQLLVEAIDLKHQRLAAVSLPIGKASARLSFDFFRSSQS